MNNILKWGLILIGLSLLCIGFPFYYTTIMLRILDHSGINVDKKFQQMQEFGQYGHAVLFVGLFVIATAYGLLTRAVPLLLSSWMTTYFTITVWTVVVNILFSVVLFGILHGGLRCILFQGIVGGILSFASMVIIRALPDGMNKYRKIALAVTFTVLCHTVHDFIIASIVLY